MRQLLELGKNLLLLFVIFLVIVFLSEQVKLRPTGDGAMINSASDTSTHLGFSNFPIERALVTKVIDGDTVLIDGGRTVRLLGMDADEHDEFCFEVAKDRLKELILNKQVVLQRELRDGDIYGRLLRYVFLDGQNIDLQLVREGFAVARASYEWGIYDKQFAEAEYAARQGRIGCKWALVQDKNL